MERKKPIVKNDLPQWQKTGGGSLRLADGRVIKPGEKFYAAEEDISKAFRDTVIPITALPEPKKPTPPTPVTFELVEDEEDGTWNVVNSEGKKMSDSQLTQEDAEQLKAELEQD